MIKYYLLVLNHKVCKYTSFVPKLFILAYYLIVVIKKYKISLSKTNYSIHNFYKLILEELDNNKLMKELVFPSSNLSELKWNIGFAIFIYLIITIF